MNTIFLTIFIIIVIIMICIFIKYTNRNHILPPPEDIFDVDIPTLHSKCDNNTSCGGDLICNKNCKRCKKKLGGDCSMDIDCDDGLKCYEWKCVSKKDKKNVKWEK